MSENLSAIEASANVYQTLRERVIGAGSPEDGSIQTKAVVYGGIPVLASALLGVAAFMGTRVETTEDITAKEGKITAIYTMPPEECHGGFDAIVQAKSEINTKLDLGFAKVPTTNRASEAFNGEMVAKVCNTAAAQGNIVIDPSEPHITITIGSEDLTTTVYPKDPTDADAWTSDVGIAAGLQKNFGNFVKTLPAGLDYKGGDAVTSVLRGQALLAASDVMSRSCGNTAWEQLRPAYAEQVKKLYVLNNNNAIGSEKITVDDVTVNLPSDVSLDNQYSEQFADLKKTAEAKGNTFTTMDPSKVVCKSNGVTVDTAKTGGSN